MSPWRISTAQAKAVRPIDGHILPQTHQQLVGNHLQFVVAHNLNGVLILRKNIEKISVNSKNI